MEGKANYLTYLSLRLSYRFPSAFVLNARNWAQPLIAPTHDTYWFPARFPEAATFALTANTYCSSGAVPQFRTSETCQYCCMVHPGPVRMNKIVGRSG